jgi:hypothetical protein
VTKKPNEGGRSKKSADERRDASEKHDVQFFTDRKAKEVSNLELTLKLRAQRLAHEATLPKQPKPAPKAKSKAKPNAKIKAKPKSTLGRP